MAEPDEPFIEAVVPAALGDERLDRAVSMLAGCSRAKAAQIISSNGVKVNGSAVTKTSTRLSAGDTLRIEDDPTDEPSAPVADQDVAFKVVFEDPHIIVVDKPAGLVVHPGAGNPTGTLVNGLLHRFPEIASVGDPGRPGIVHRLDAGTSGLMVVARDAESYERLVDDLAARAVHRTYSALVKGHLDHPRGVIDAPVGRSRRDPLKMTVSVEGKDARTHYEVDQEFVEPAPFSLITCRLETGRTHQIRVHLSSIGHPVAGDDRYGGATRSLRTERPFLHARELGFSHPVSEEEMAFVSDIPADLTEILTSLSE